MDAWSIDFQSMNDIKLCLAVNILSLKYINIHFDEQNNTIWCKSKENQLFYRQINHHYIGRFLFIVRAKYTCIQNMLSFDQKFSLNTSSQESYKTACKWIVCNDYFKFHTSLYTVFLSTCNAGMWEFLSIPQSLNYNKLISPISHTLLQHRSFSPFICLSLSPPSSPTPI